MTVSALLIFAGALVIAAGAPGPSVAALVARVLSSGWRAVLPFLAAMWIGEGVWLTCAAFGLAFLAAAFHVVFVAVKYLGVAYLAFLAWRMWRAPVAAAEAELPRGSGWRMFATGMAITLGNPKIMLFYLALLPSLIDLGHVNGVAWAELVATMFVVLMAVDLTWVALATQARRLIRSARAMRACNRFSATVMALAAAAIAAR